MRGAVRHRAGGEEVQGRRRWLLRGLPVSGLSVCLHTISSPRQWVVCLSPYRIIASCAAAPSSITKSSDDCGWSAGARGGRRGGGGGESGGRRSHGDGDREQHTGNCRSGGGLRDRMCVGEGAVRLSVSSWLRHHSSVTISSPRVRQRRAAGRVATAVERRNESGGRRGTRRPHGGGGGGGGGGGEGGEGGDGR
jgi:hypothetical protein